jgi:hypothetical protein
MEKSSLEEGKKIGENFLTKLDEFLKKHQDDMTCNDLYELYYGGGKNGDKNEKGFFYKLKEFRGTSGGFTGFSELLIFRFLYNYLQEEVHCKLKCEGKTEDTKHFVSENPKIKLTQGLKIEHEELSCKPDIAVYHEDELKAVFEIKVYPPKGQKTIEAEEEKLTNIRSKFPSMWALLVVFRCPKGGKAKDELSETEIELKEFARKHKWFGYIILEREENTKLKTVLTETLRLDRLKRTKKGGSRKVLCR